jgi:hypothetical protein
VTLNHLFDPRPAGIFMTHVVSDRITAHFERLRCQSNAFVDWHFICNRATFQEVLDEASRARPSLGQPRIMQALQHGQIHSGCLDLLWTPLALAAGRRFVWIIEYDVDYSGNWADFFSQFMRNRADLLASTINTFDRDPGWPHWASAVNPSSVPVNLRTRSFLPSFRVSRRFLRSYCRQVARGGWAGHYEFIYPTIARSLGLIVEDIGSSGPFTPASRRGQNYINTPDHPHLTPGTFVWRPSRKMYFHEKPEEFPAENMLYHPVKPDIAEWETRKNKRE